MLYLTADHSYHNRILNPSGLTEAEDIIIERISALENLISSQYISRYISVQGRYSSRESTEESEQSDICSEYKVGEERILSVPFLSLEVFSMPFFQLQSYYKVRRISSKAYQISLALEISPALTYYNEFVPRGQMYEHYMEKIKFCIRNANHSINGPDGQKLSIRIEDAQKMRTCSPIHPIRIHNLENLGYDRHSFFMSYDTEASCAYIFHELLHLFGLSDTYELKLIEIMPEGLENYFSEDSIFDCRVVQPNNIMFEASKRWADVFTDSTETSLIDPVHFNAIIYGNCSTRNDVRLFRQCSSLTFQSSLTNPGCLRQKAYCERQNFLGRDKNKELEILNNLLQTKQERFDGFKMEFDLETIINQSSTDGFQNEDEAYLEELEMEVEELERRISLVEQWPD